ncbi:MAG: acetyl-CoA synthetase [Candidatus Lokiarchaeota archaeon]|nr:acetyl-CoA synthetase [Candidatus Lokiarchaeota archaeon]
MSKLDVFFNPKTIAIIGASDTPKFGYPTTKYLLNSKFKTYPVHIYKDTILGHKAYKKIKDIPDSIELAIILVSNKSVLQAVKDCVEKDVKGIIIESAGFAETNIKEFVDIQAEIHRIAKESGIRIIGPNCVGVTNFENKFTSTEVNFQEEEFLVGNISIVAQSGVLGNVFIDWGVSQKLAFSKSITLGNKVDVDEIDMLEYLNDDPNTKVITLYLEGVKRGPEFMSILKKITKPILIVKNGRSSIGSKAIQSHTGSIAGNDAIYDAIFKQHGCIFRVNDFYEMFNVAKCFSMQPLNKGENVAIITGSGSLGILACDQIKNKGLKLANLKNESISKMRKVAPKWVSVKNPVDLGPSQFLTLEPALKAVFNDSNVDCILFIFTVPKNPLQTFGYSFDKPLKLIQKLVETHQKPLIISCFGSRWVFDYVIDKALKYNLPVITSITDAITAFKIMNEFYNFLHE